MPRMSAEQTARLESSIGRARKGIRQVSSPAATTTTINSSRVIPYDDRFMEIKVISGWRHKSRKIRQISHSIPRSSLVKPLRLSPIPLKTQPTLRFELRRAGSCLPHSPPHIIIIYIYASWQKTCFFTHSFARRAVILKSHFRIVRTTGRPEAAAVASGGAIFSHCHLHPHTAMAKSSYCDQEIPAG